jgi:uncharacterized protein
MLPDLLKNILNLLGAATRELASQDPMRIEVPARTVGEPRWLVVGRMGGRHWSAVVTYRGDRIRITSVRRARDEEIEIYEV